MWRSVCGMSGHLFSGADFRPLFQHLRRGLSSAIPTFEARTFVRYSSVLLLNYYPLAKTSPQISFGLSSLMVFAHSSIVAPVVQTSSIMMIVLSLKKDRG